MTPKDTMLFIATFADGNQIFQTNPDVSVNGGANCYSDVMAYEKESKLISFIIKNAECLFGVDLQDGHFECNGVPFFQHRHDREHSGLTDFRLIWFRTTGIHTTMGGENPGMTASVSYNIGWQANDKDGKNVQRILKTRPFATTDGDK